MLTASFIRNLETILSKKLGKKTHIRRLKPLSGGSINQAARVDTTSGVFFLKANDAYRYPGMFEKEVHGLNALRETKQFTIPEFILTGDEEGQAFLILEFIEPRQRVNDFWERFGTSLARQHRVTTHRYGYAEDNFIGSLVQSNKEHNRWTDFFIEERLKRQLQLALQSGKMGKEEETLFNKFFGELDSLIPEESPAFLHGDLWNGNFMTGDRGEPVLIDPAVYYGHREMDLAMTHLFGGFDPVFYESYNSEYPLQAGFDQRIEIHNLYPLMVHVNLFGGGYVNQVKQILKKFQRFS